MSLIKMLECAIKLSGGSVDLEFVYLHMILIHCGPVSQPTHKC